MKTYKVYVSGEWEGYVEIEAESEEEATAVASMSDILLADEVTFSDVQSVDMIVVEEEIK